MPLTNVESIVQRSTLGHLDSKITLLNKQGIPTSDITETIDILYEEIHSMTDPSLPEGPVTNLGDLHAFMTRAAEAAGMKVKASYHTFSRESGTVNLHIVFEPPEGFGELPQAGARDQFLEDERETYEEHRAPDRKEATS